MENLGLGLELMLIGMASVFIILIIVILIGKLLISVTNRFPTGQQDASASKAKYDEASGPEAVGNVTRKIIEATVKELTEGRGTVKEIIRM